MKVTDSRIKLRKLVKIYKMHFLREAPNNCSSKLHNFIFGAQWLSGRVIDSKPNGRGFEPHRRHCVVSSSKNINASLVLVPPRN